MSLNYTLTFLADDVLVGEDRAASGLDGGTTAAEGDAQTGEVTTETQQQAQPEQQGSSWTLYSTIAIYAAIIFAFYFFLIRPQKKREKLTREMQAAIKVGDDIITSSGMFGVVVSVGEDCFVVEFGTNKGIRIPVRKVDVLGAKAPVLTPAAPVKDDGFIEKK